MTEALTSPELLSALPEIAEQPEDTPRSVGRERRIPTVGVLARAFAPIMATPIMSGSDPFAVSQDMTVLVEEERGEGSSLHLPVNMFFHEQFSQVPEAETANHTRLELLARQYVAGQLSTEEEARLAIVSERVRRLIPRVTVEDFEVLERILEEAASIESADIERRRRLGID
jgi:hypothetical protein